MFRSPPPLLGLGHIPAFASVIAGQNPQSHRIASSRVLRLRSIDNVRPYGTTSSYVLRIQFLKPDSFFEKTSAIGLYFFPVSPGVTAVRFNCGRVLFPLTYLLAGRLVPVG